MSVDLQQKILNSDLIYSLTKDLPNPSLISDVADNDSDKTLTVPANQIWEILWISIEYIATSTSGSREVSIDFLDSSNDVIATSNSFTTQVASSSRLYMGTPGNYYDLADWRNTVIIPLPLRSLLPAGFKIRVYDKEAIDPTADDMIIHMMVNRFDV